MNDIDRAIEILNHRSTCMECVVPTDKNNKYDILDSRSKCDDCDDAFNMAIEALKQQKQGYINQSIIAKSLSSTTADGVRLKRLIAKSIESGDLKLIRVSDNLKKQGYMNKLMQEVEVEE